MRFKKGDKVEVLSQKELPSGSWRCAEIICGNGHNYTVRYDGCASTKDRKALERVSRKSIRPCPPIFEVSEFWVPGDVVEMLDNFSWKMATISRVLGKKYCLVRLLGSSLEFKVSKFDIRVRQSWQDDKWAVIGEGSGCWGDARHAKTLTLYCPTSSFQVKKTNTRKNLHVNDDNFPFKNKVKIQESHIASSKALKRGSPFCHSQFEGYNGSSKKFRAIDKGGKIHRVIAGNPSSLPEQADVGAFQREVLGEKYMHPLINDGTSGILEVEADRRKSTGAVGCTVALNLESNDAHSVTCSVGSCSIGSNNSFKLPRHVSAGLIEDCDGNSSDAESFCQLGYEEGNCFLPKKDELAAEIHRAEVGGLHTSLPMSQDELGSPVSLKYLHAEGFKTRILWLPRDDHYVDLRKGSYNPTVMFLSNEMRLSDEQWKLAG